jgi:branched-subunit amino acid transport protein
MTGTHIYLTGAGFAVLVALCAIVTYLTRWPAMLLGRTWHPSPRIARTFRYIPIGVFAAMVAPAVVWHPAAAGHLDWAFLCATLVALVVAIFTKKPLWAMLGGVLTIAVWHAL